MTTKRKLVGLKGGAARELTITGAVGLAAGALLVAFASLDTNGAGALLGAIALATICTMGPLVFLRERAPMEPVTFYAGVSFASFVFPSLFWFGQPGGNPAFLTSRDVTAALLLVAGAFTAVWSGYFVTRGISHARSLTEPTRRREVAPLWFLGALATVGIGSRLALISAGTYGYQAATDPTIASGLNASLPYLQWVQVAGTALEAAVLLAAFGALSAEGPKSRRKLLAVAIALAAVDLGFGMLSGFKGAFVPMTILLLLVYGRLRMRFPWKAVLGCVAVLLLTAPLNLQYRDLSSHASGTRSAPDLVREAFADTLSGRGVTGGQTATTLLARVRQIDSIAVVIRDTPRPRPYRRGHDLLLGTALVLVPRFLWQDKPILQGGRDFAREYLGQRGEVLSSTGVTQIGDLYRNFSIWGVLVGMLVMGGLLGALGRALERVNPVRLLLGGFTLLVLVQVESDLLALVASGLRTIFVAGLIAGALRLVSVWRARRPAVPADLDAHPFVDSKLHFVGP